MPASNRRERPFNDSERQKLREQIRSFYEGFVEKVAASRKMPVERVDQLAQGRVWTGAQARSTGWSMRWAGSIARSRWRKNVRASRPIPKSRS